MYNTAKYLPQCLDSILAQTFENFEVLCVDHSSTDSSLALLQEYADKDNRIRIISCINTGGGPGEARNAALEHVRGKYTYFCDSDDWIHPTLCEKAYYRLERSSADVTFFFHHPVKEETVTASCRHHDTSQRGSIPQDYADFACFPWACSPWNRMIRTALLREISFRFPEGQLPEDVFLHWALLGQEPKVEVIAEKLYFHRYREGSQMTLRGENVAKTCQVFAYVKKYLQKIGKYGQYRELLLVHKYMHIASHYPLLRKEWRAKSVQWLRETVDEDEVHFLMREESLDVSTRARIQRMLYGHASVKMRFGDLFKPAHTLLKTLNRLVIRPIVKPIESAVRHRTRRRLLEQIDKYNRLLALRDKEIVELRESFGRESRSVDKIVKRDKPLDSVSGSGVSKFCG